MSIAVLIWSLYPLGVTIGLKSMTTLEMILIIYFFAGLGASILAPLYLWKKGLLNKAFEIQKTLDVKAYTLILVSGVVGVLCHAFFIIALTLANKGGVSLLYESWPVLAIIATPFLMKKKWKEVSFKEFMVSIVALVGVAIIILTDHKVGASGDGPRMITGNIDYNALGGYILAFAGAYMLALTVITKAAFSEYFKNLKDDFGATLISEMVSRTICVVVILALFMTFNITFEDSNINWGASFFIGFIVFVLGGIFYTYSLLRSDSPLIHTLNYFVPVLAIIWLWIAGETTVNSGLFVGGAIVTACNIYLVRSARAAKLPDAAKY